MRACVHGLLLWLALLVPTAQATQVVFINPGRADEPFWRGYAQFMHAAARDLGLELQIVYAERDPQRLISTARRVLQGAQRPDYLLFVNEYYTGPEILRLSAGSGVKLFSVNSTLTADQQQVMGGTREKYPDWIGSMVANEEEAGYLMARALIRQADSRQPLQMLAFSGVKNTPAAQLREQGLQRALNENPQVQLRQLVYADWNRQRAGEQADLLLRRYPDVRLIWSANDEMAFGVMASAAQLPNGQKPKLLYSALNNSEEVLQARQSGRVSALVAGHFTLGGWALVLISDHAAGLDFAQRGGKDRTVRLFMELDATQAARLQRVLRQDNYGLNFRRFTARQQPGMRNYAFSLQPLLAQPVAK